VIVSGRLEPGIGITVGPSERSQASATCCGETPWARAAALTAPIPAAESDEAMPPSGDHARNAMPRSVHASTSPLAIGDVWRSESWFCTDTTSTIVSASSSCATLAFEMPTQRTLPSSWSSLNAPIDSA
jgi:hypothetical protein